MSATARSTDYSFGDFCFLIADGQKADLIDGAIYMASPDNTDANALSVWLIALVGFFVDRNELGRVFASRVAFRLDGKNGPEPDLAFVRQSRLHLVKRGHVAGRPDAAMEIVSPESVTRDYIEKRAQFERAGIPEYWIIDESERKITLLRLGAHGKYREVRAVQGVLRSRALPGFWLRPSWLWQKPLPKMQAILDEILGAE